ncbi:hypothetical protein BH18THE2_BH18THE2_30570 [soil metagenome]
MKEKVFEIHPSNIQFKETVMTTVTILVVDRKESFGNGKDRGFQREYY